MTYQNMKHTESELKVDKPNLVVTPAQKSYNEVFCNIQRNIDYFYFVNFTVFIKY